MEFGVTMEILTTGGQDEHSISYSTPTTFFSARIKYNPWVLIEFISIPGVWSITQSKAGWLSKKKWGWTLVKQEIEVNSLMAAGGFCLLGEIQPQKCLVFLIFHISVNFMRVMKSSSKSSLVTPGDHGTPERDVRFWGWTQPSTKAQAIMRISRFGSICQEPAVPTLGLLSGAILSSHDYPGEKSMLIYSICCRLQFQELLISPWWTARWNMNSSFTSKSRITSKAKWGKTNPSSYSYPRKTYTKRSPIFQCFHLENLFLGHGEQVFIPQVLRLDREWSKDKK